MADDAAAAGGEAGGGTTPVAGAPDNKNAPTGTGTDPAKKPDNSSQEFDPSKLSDDDYAKILSDPRSFTHPRFKALTERAAEADKLKAENEKATNARLAEEKKYQELAEKHEASANDWKSKFETASIDNRIAAEASKLGITDLEAASKLIDRSGITIDESGAVNGVEAAVKALAESKTYLVDKSKQVPTIGSPSNPANGNQGEGSVKSFKASEIRDPSFYKEHEKDILAAMKVPGAIVNDLGSAV